MDLSHLTLRERQVKHAFDRELMLESNLGQVIRTREGESETPDTDDSEVFQTELLSMSCFDG